MALNIGYTTIFKLGDKVKAIGDDELIMIVKAIRLDPIENSKEAAVLYLCGWFNGGAAHDTWLPYNMLKEIK